MEPQGNQSKQMKSREDKSEAELIMPTRKWHEKLNFLNVLLIIFLFLTLISGKKIIEGNRPADVMSGLNYFLKKFFPRLLRIHYHTKLASRNLSDSDCFNFFCYYFIIIYFARGS